MITFLMRSCGRGILLIGLLMTLVACDGGIFGTGDGSSVSVTDDTNAGAPETDSSAGTQSPDAGIDQPGDAVQDSAAELRSFENLQIGSDSDLPLLALVNFSSISLNISTPDTDRLFATAIPSGSISNDASIALGTTRLSVVDATSSVPLLELSPLNLGAFSVSTLIARDRLLADDTPDNNPAILPDVQIIAIPSQRLPSGDGVARVRLLQVSPLDTDDQAASMSLIPADGTPGGSETDLGMVSAASFGTQSDYLAVAPGSYRLVDSLGRLDPVPVELTGGEFQTLILTGAPVKLVVLQDSQVSGQDASALKKRP